MFAGWAAAATAAAVALAGGVGVVSWTGLKQRYPFESLSPRLAYENAPLRQIGHDPSPTLREDTLWRLQKAEKERHWNRRGEALRLVHAGFVEQFVESPGFGVGRMIRPTPYSIAMGDKRSGVLYKLDRRPDLAGSPDVAAESLGELDERSPSADALGPLDALHDAARQDFLNPGGFGYFRDRDRVAGFVSHGFLNYQPWFFTRKGHGRWLAVRVDLVSLLKHERPMVYVSENLPNMNELRDAPVRELDTFEQRALNSLIQGEDLVPERRVGRIRTVGSLRATSQCLDCHQVERGTLLGAFSYEFLRDPPPLRLRDSDPVDQTLL